MRIGLQTWGSHGDIRPFVALADGLHAAGHAVTLVLSCVDSDRYRSLRTRFDLQVVATPVIADAAQLARMGRDIVEERHAIRQTQRVIEQFLLPAEAEMVRASEQLCASHDLVIGHYFLHTLAIAAERHGRPCMAVALADGAMPSAAQPPAGMPPLGAWGNRLAWRLARAVLNRAFKPYPDRLRASLGMAPARDMMDTVWASEFLTLVAISPALCQPQADWPAQYQLCGALDTPDSVAEGELPDTVRAFLDAGAAPVFMGLGSMMAGGDEAQTLALLVAAAQAAGVRALIQAPSWQRLGQASNEQIHFVSAAPHAALFPHCSAVLHHGGAGTCHAALRAGRPAVLMPHTAEQSAWAQRLQRIGVAGPAVARRGATVARLAAAIGHCLGSPRLRQTAQAIGLRMAREDGVATAVRLIEERMASAAAGRRPPSAPRSPS